MLQTVLNILKYSYACALCWSKKQYSEYKKMCLLLFRHVALNYTLECSHIFVSTLQLLTMSHATNERIFCNVQTAQAPYLPKFSFLVFFFWLKHFNKAIHHFNWLESTCMSRIPPANRLSEDNSMPLVAPLCRCQRRTSSMLLL